MNQERRNNLYLQAD